MSIRSAAGAFTGPPAAARGPGASSTDSPSAGTRASKPRSRAMRAASASAASASPWVTKTARGGAFTPESQRIISPASACPERPLRSRTSASTGTSPLWIRTVLRAVEERAAERARGLVAGDQQRVLGRGAAARRQWCRMRPPESMPLEEMMTAGPFIVVERLATRRACGGGAPTCRGAGCGRRCC